MHHVCAPTPPPSPTIQSFSPVLHESCEQPSSRYGVQCYSKEVVQCSGENGEMTSWNILRHVLQRWTFWKVERTRSQKVTANELREINDDSKGERNAFGHLDGEMRTRAVNKTSRIYRLALSRGRKTALFPRFD